MTFACQHRKGGKLIHRLIFYSRLWSRYFQRESLTSIDNGVQVVGILGVLAQHLYDPACIPLVITLNHLLTPDLLTGLYTVYISACVHIYIPVCFSFQTSVPFNQYLIHTIKMSLENVVPQGNTQPGNFTRGLVIF